MKVEVYRNLHNGKYSIKSLTGPSKGLVVAHADEVWIDQPEFRVSQSGRARVLKERKKYVHAVVRGYLSNWSGRETNPAKHGQLPTGHHDDIYGRSHRNYEVQQIQEWGKSFTYNPFKYDSFVTADADEQPIHTGYQAVLSTKCGCLVADPEAAASV
jgi:hypothetical protein